MKPAAMAGFFFSYAEAGSGVGGRLLSMGVMNQGPAIHQLRYGNLPSYSQISVAFLSNLLQSKALTELSRNGCFFTELREGHDHARQRGGKTLPKNG
jgi:hypothetical protein